MRAPVQYERIDGQLIVVAAAGGSAQPPAWWHNLEAEATVTVQIGWSSRRSIRSPAPCSPPMPSKRRGRSVSDEMSAQPPPPPAPPSPLRGKTVRGAMQFGLFSCPPDIDLSALARLMVDRSIHCVVVRNLDAGERYGIASHLDLVRGLEDPEARVAGDVAKTDVVTVLPDATLTSAAQLMTAHGTAHLIVVSPATGLPVGIVSSLDIARVAAT